MGIRSAGVTGVERSWTASEAERGMALQKQYLEFCAGGQDRIFVMHWVICFKITMFSARLYWFDAPFKKW